VDADRDTCGNTATQERFRAAPFPSQKRIPWYAYGGETRMQLSMAAQLQNMPISEHKEDAEEAHLPSRNCDVHAPPRRDNTTVLSCFTAHRARVAIRVVDIYIKDMTCHFKRY
jgi:hypothetical protein